MGSGGGICYTVLVKKIWNLDGVLPFLWDFSARIQKMKKLVFKWSWNGENIVCWQ